MDAHSDGKRFVVRSDEKLTAFLELEVAIHQFAVSLITGNQWPRAETGVSASTSAVPPKDSENAANTCNGGV